jgi:tetratricopeptide (TPR) repeat protein
VSAAGEVAGYAFLSYAREDKEHVDQLQETLEAAGIPVWRDIRDLQPGQDWKLSIRRAVSEDALAFLACFSKASQGKPKGYQNEELWLAAEQSRLRLPGRSWLIPVRFDDCAVPDLDLGGGRTLASLQRADLFGETRVGHTTRLIDAILEILSRDPGVTTSAKETLNRRVAVAEAVAALREAVRLDPRYAYAHRRLGAALLDQGHYNEAEAAEREAIRLDPHNAFAHSRLGEALRLQGRLAEAVTALREAVRLDPRYA